MLWRNKIMPSSVKTIFVSALPLIFAGCVNYDNASPAQISRNAEYFQTQSQAILAKEPTEKELVWRCRTFGQNQYFMFSKKSPMTGNGQQLEKAERLPLAQYGLVIMESFAAISQEKMNAKDDGNFSEILQNTNALSQGANSNQIKRIFDSCMIYLNKPENKRYLDVGMKASKSELE